MEDEIMTVADARERYQLSKYKMTALIKSGAIPVFDNPRDGRSQLVKASDVVKALQPPQGKPKTRKSVNDVMRDAAIEREAQRAAFAQHLQDGSRKQQEEALTKREATE